MSDELERLKARLEQLEQLVKAQDSLLTAYRLRDDRLAERAITRLAKAREALK